MTIDVLAEVGPTWHDDGFLVEASTHHDGCRPSMAHYGRGFVHCGFQLRGGKVIAERDVARWQGRPGLHSATNQPCRLRGDPRIDPANQTIERMMICAHCDKHEGGISVFAPPTAGGRDR